MTTNETGEEIMASITKRYKKTKATKGEKVLSGWDVQSSKITSGYVVFHCAASRYDESDANKRREILAEVEKAFSKGKAISSDLIDEIQSLNDPNFIDWLIKNGVLKPVKVLSFEGLLEMALKGFAEQGTKPQTLRLIKIGGEYLAEYLNEKRLDIPVASIDKRLARDFWTWFKQKSAANNWTPRTINAYLSNILYFPQFFERKSFNEV